MHPPPHPLSATFSTIHANSIRFSSHSASSRFSPQTLHQIRELSSDVTVDVMVLAITTHVLALADEMEAQEEVEKARILAQEKLEQEARQRESLISAGAPSDASFGAMASPDRQLSSCVGRLRPHATLGLWPRSTHTP